MTKLEIRTTDAAGEVGIFAVDAPEHSMPLLRMIAEERGTGTLQAMVDVYNASIDRENSAEKLGFESFSEQFGVTAHDARRFQFLGATEVGNALAGRRIAGHHFDFEGQAWNIEGDAIQDLRDVVDAEIESVNAWQGPNP